MSRARKADQVADDLLRGIVSGQLVVGSLLPKEAELATQHGVNRSVVREAVKLLEVHRLVRPVRRRGTEVLDPMASLSPEVLEAMLSPREGHIDREVLADFLEIRAALDIEMASLVARRHTAEDLAGFEQGLEELAAAGPDRARYAAATDAMALRFARATHNRIYVMLVCWNQEVAAKMPAVFATARPANEPHLQAMRLLIQIIRQREAEQVRTLVTAFHEWATPRILAAAALSSGEPLSNLGASTR